MEKTETTSQNHSVAIKGLETQIGQLSRTISERPQGALPSNTKTYLREHVQAITTRSGVQLPEITVKNQ